MNELPRKGSLLAPDDEPPGGWFDDGETGLRVWKGESYWRTQHGPAMVQWNYGRPAYAWDVLMPDGARTQAMSRWPASDTFRVVRGAVITHGTLDMSVNDAVFVSCADQPVLEVKDEHRALFELLANDASVARDLERRENAQSLSWLLENAILQYGEHTFEFGTRDNAHLVAALRACGEDYLDFAWGQYGGPTDEGKKIMRAHLARLSITGAQEA